MKFNGWLFIIVLVSGLAFGVGFNVAQHEDLKIEMYDLGFNHALESYSLLNLACDLHVSVGAGDAEIPRGGGATYAEFKSASFGEQFAVLRVRHDIKAEREYP